MGTPTRVPTSTTSTGTASYFRLPGPAAFEEGAPEQELSALVLRPLNVPLQLAAALPEGEIVTVENPVLAPQKGLRLAGVASPFTGAAASQLSAVAQTLTSGGFNAIPGGYSIGLIGVPRWGSPGEFIPALFKPFGHTAVFLRLNGQIAAVRGFMPASTVESVLNIRSVFGAEAAVRQTAGVIDATISNDLWLFTNSSARAIEWAIPEQLALHVAETLPELGTPPPGGATYYTGRSWAVPKTNPVSGKAMNCVEWAAGQVEGALGGRVGAVGPDGQVIPVTQPAKVDGGLQGQFTKLAKAAGQNPEVLGSMPEATGLGVVSTMPRYLHMLRWVGRLFIVIGAALVIVETVRAPEEQRTRTFVGASAGFGGSLLAGAVGGQVGLVAGAKIGAAMGLACGPGAPACAIVGAIVFGAAFGLIGYYATRAVAESVYDGVTAPPEPPTPEIKMPGGGGGRRW